MLEEAHDRASEILEELLSMYADEYDSQNQAKIISQLEELESQLSKTGDYLHECTYADGSKQMITHAPPVGFALAESRPTNDQIDQSTESWFRKYVHEPSSASEHTRDQGERSKRTQSSYGEVEEEEELEDRSAASFDWYGDADGLSTRVDNCGYDEQRTVRASSLYGGSEWSGIASGGAAWSKPPSSAMPSVS